MLPLLGYIVTLLLRELGINVRRAAAGAHSRDSVEDQQQRDDERQARRERDAAVVLHFYLILER